MGLSLSTQEGRFLRCALLIVLYSLPAWLTFAPSSAIDLDVWWHLRTGQWILQNGWVPYFDSFSSYGMGKPWAAYSWLFEVLVYKLFTSCGPVGLIIYVYLLLLSITAALHSLVRRYEQRLVFSVALTTAAILGMVSLRTPRPWLFTVLFFTIELNILVKVRQTRDYRWLLLLPPIFALWANLHIQFIYGLFILGLIVIEHSFNRLFQLGHDVHEIQDYQVPLRRITPLIAACILATFLNPYHFKIYSVVFATVRESGFYDLISELQAMRFRDFSEWIVLALTLGSAYALGRARIRNFFWVSMFLTGVYLSFRSGRDLWFVTIVATTIIARARLLPHAERSYVISKTEASVMLILVLAISVLGFWVNGVSNQKIQERVAKNFPVDAVSFIQAQGISGRLYNPFNWGGYLIWQLQNVPVSIDGRGNLHSPDRLSRVLKVWRGEHDWFSNPELRSSTLVIAPKDAPLTQLLRLEPSWQLIYEDSVATVFVAK